MIRDVLTVAVAAAVSFSKFGQESRPTDPDEEIEVDYELYPNGGFALTSTRPMAWDLSRVKPKAERS